MAQIKGTKIEEFDSIVVGSGLAGLIAAHQLEGTGRKVALIEGLDILGGGSRPTSSSVGTIDHSLKFFPNNSESIEALEWLSGMMGEGISWEEMAVPPTTYDDGKFKPFIGFGDQNVRTATEIDAYATEKFLRLNSTPKDWVQKLIASFTGIQMTQSIVTKMQTDDEFVIELLVNGSKRVSGREVLFCALPQQLTRLLPEANVPPRLRQKLLKGEFWTSVNLSMVHKGQVTENMGAHVLKGANEEPSVGYFQPPTVLADGNQAQLSQWVTLVPKDITDEAELVASALKQIKRQVKRAYETSLDGLIQERIVVSPSSHGDLTGVLPEDGKWPKLQNLWVVSGFMDSQKNTLGAIRQVRRTLAAVAGEPAEAIEFEKEADTTIQPTV